MNLKLLWEEDFRQQEFLNTNLWNYDIGDGSESGIPGWGNGERENYTRESIGFSNGLEIKATRYDPDRAPDIYYGKAEWQSGKIHTLGKVAFKYGRLQVRAKAPAGGGSWPAIWMLGESLSAVGWPACGEIDIFEGAGNRPHQICGTLHGPGFSGDKGVGVAKDYPQPVSAAFHEYTIDWFPDEISWSVDGDVYSTLKREEMGIETSSWPFNEPFYLILNLAIGGWFGGEVEETMKTAKFSIESIKYFSIDGFGEIALVNK